MFVRYVVYVLQYQDCDSASIKGYEGKQLLSALNSMIASFFCRFEEHNTQQFKTNASFNLKLIKSDRDRLIVKGYNNLVNCVNMHCLPDLGCIHPRQNYFYTSVDIVAKQVAWPAQ